MALDFLILYEHVVREYESILLLKAELARRGYTVELRQLLDRKKLKYFTLKKPKVLVSSCMYDDEAINSHVYNNIGVCNKVVNLHWEQMLSDTQEEGAWFNFGGNAKKCVQTCWGKRTQQRLVAHGMQEKNCPVTGAVMMDFLRPEFRGYFKDKAALCREHGLDPDKKLMLYISSFGYASMTEQEVKELSDMAGEDFTDFAGTNRTSMEQTLAWFDQYLAGHPEVQLVYRRHPSEWNSPALEALAQKRPNFRVIFADSVKQWIVAADQIFIWMSTAIAEVYFAGKSCRILRPVPIEHEYDPVIYKGADHITDYAAFAAAADACATVSGISFGPWHIPDRNTPAVGLSTGRSFGWASVKKSFVSMEAVSMVASGRADLSGSMAAASTTMSASMCSCRLSSRSEACTFSLPFSGVTLPTMPLM